MADPWITLPEICLCCCTVSTAVTIDCGAAMALYSYQALANGLRTDHPIPDLPFVDDSHIPVEDAAAVEAVGRRRGTDMWGREDPVHEGGWIAFTTDPGQRDLAWVVRWHPAHGRSVILYRDDEAASVYTVFLDSPLLFRAGGYWWDGTTWYRPGQIWDAASEDFYRRPVPAAATVTAADMLGAADGDPARGRVLDIASLDDGPYEGHWPDDLARWAQNRDPETLARSVITLTAPELAADQLIGTAELAEISGLAASTLRAYAARAEADVPQPQAVIGGRNMWSRPVAEEWAEARSRSPEGLLRAVSASGDTPPGVEEAAAGMARSFHALLWGYRPFRSRWALRWRSKAAVGEVADELGAEAARYMVRSLVPTGALSATIYHAVLDELAYGLRLENATRDHGALHEAGPDDAPGADAVFFGINSAVAQMLDWLIRHNPRSAGLVIGEIIGEAGRRLGIPRAVTEYSLALALNLDGKLNAQAREEFLRRVMTPGAELTAPSRRA